MDENLERGIKFLQAKPELAGYVIHQEGQELHLSKGSDCFVRLVPTDKPETWRMEHFHNKERWEHVGCTCSLEECIDFLSENPQFFFWEG